LITPLVPDLSTETILAAAPPGTTDFIAKVTLTRTKAPANTWNGTTIQVRPEEGVEITYAGGSILLEQVLGMSRSMSLYIENNNLVLHQQQSVGPGPGFANNNAGGNGGNSMEYQNSDLSEAGEWSYGGSGPGLIVAARASDSYSYQVLTQKPKGSDPGPGWSGYLRRFNNNAGIGSRAVAVDDNTDYSSTYALGITGKFVNARLPTTD
jgi:hypothetical protein